MRRWIFCILELIFLFLFVGCVGYLRVTPPSQPPSLPSSAASFSPQEEGALEIPRSQDTTLRVRHRKGFSYGFSPRWRQSVWVGYQFLSEELSHRVPRAKKFMPDPEEALSASDEDYRNSGFDRGHLAPASDMRWDAEAMRESFYFTNISPQVPAFNRGVWKRLEEQVRTWTHAYDTLYVVTGPLFLRSPQYIGRQQIPVPSHFYKALLTKRNNQWESVAFVIENKKTIVSLDDVRCTVDSLEQLSGLDFFSPLDDSVESRVESQYHAHIWSLPRKRSSQ